MSTSSDPIPATNFTLRLRINPRTGRDSLDGGWWPHSRDLTVELADLVDHFPVERGRVVRALYSPPDWLEPPRRIPVAGRYVKAGKFPRDDTHLMLLSLADRTVLRLLVVPPALSADKGEEALRAAAAPGNKTSAGSVLDAVGRRPDTDAEDQWNDGGTSWWHPEPTAPSYRTGP